MNNRISDTTTIVDGIVILSEGNPGAAVTLAEFAKRNEAPLFHVLDEYKIYGSRIWVLYKDWCEQDFDKMAALLCLSKIGLFDPKLFEQLDGRGVRPSEVEKIFAKRPISRRSW